MLWNSLCDYEYVLMNFKLVFSQAVWIDLSCSSIGLYVNREFGVCPMAPKVKSSLFGCKNLVCIVI